ncbi:tRNA(Ile)-lysidine synthase [Alishewanella longhuensis]|uniref:tRNA(Ile)-lysidine synthase n=1 Tax=Alishewanella longhuensis TaxID=1091037 RepID=A0ABQ3KW41_9ALTE|nr:tRNA lysidine(34) synthetase TilS [Alishewanella longhuensis]GHG64558.1 tRNA(Ile)-lysidine synthase [Alishewanella longhuensis]
MLNLQQHIKAALLQQLQQHPPAELRLVLAYSGGLDSQVLLHLLAPLCQQMAIPFSAVHVHHGLNVKADSWAAFCQEQCQRRQVDFNIRYVQLTKPGNIEQQARTARYEALADFISTSNTLLLTAHHADDQLETVLLALKRGAGVTGLSAMPAVRAFAAGKLVRPLLAISRQQLHDYAHSVQLAWIDDDSNQNIDFDRNFLREQVTPILKQRWPALLQTVSRSLQHLQNTAELADFYTKQALKQCLFNNRLNLQQLHQFHPLQQDLVLRSWLGLAGLNPETQWLTTLKQQVINARQDAMPQLQLGKLQIRRYQHWLYCLAERPEILNDENLKLNVGENLQLANGLGYFTWDKEPTAHSLPVAGSATAFNLAFGLLSSVFKPAGRPGKPLKQWFKLWQVPPWQRTRVPLLFHSGELQLVAGYASVFKSAQATVWLNWQPASDELVYPLNLHD